MSRLFDRILRGVAEYNILILTGEISTEIKLRLLYGIRSKILPLRDVITYILKNYNENSLSVLGYILRDPQRHKEVDGLAQSDIHEVSSLLKLSKSLDTDIHPDHLKEILLIMLDQKVVSNDYTRMIKYFANNTLNAFLTTCNMVPTESKIQKDIYQNGMYLSIKYTNIHAFKSFLMKLGRLPYYHAQVLLTKLEYHFNCKDGIEYVQLMTMMEVAISSSHKFDTYQLSSMGKALPNDMIVYKSRSQAKLYNLEKGYLDAITPTSFRVKIAPDEEIEKIKEIIMILMLDLTLKNIVDSLPVSLDELSYASDEHKRYTKYKTIAEYISDYA